jgi:hypothetical protein
MTKNWEREKDHMHDLYATALSTPQSLMSEAYTFVRRDRYMVRGMKLSDMRRVMEEQYNFQLVSNSTFVLPKANLSFQSSAQGEPLIEEGALQLR